jgi:hypothetical protein
MGDRSREAMSRFARQRPLHRFTSAGCSGRSEDESCGDAVLRTGERFLQKAPNMQTICQCRSAIRGREQQFEMEVGCERGPAHGTDNDPVGTRFPGGWQVRPDEAGGFQCGSPRHRRRCRSEADTGVADPYCIAEQAKSLPMVPDAIVQAAGNGFGCGIEHLAMQFATDIAFVDPPARGDGDARDEHQASHPEGRDKAMLHRTAGSALRGMRRLHVGFDQSQVGTSR